jgi:hypothetical protein
MQKGHDWAQENLVPSAVGIKTTTGSGREALELVCPFRIVPSKPNKWKLLSLNHPVIGHRPPSLAGNDTLCAAVP